MIFVTWLVIRPQIAPQRASVLTARGRGTCQRIVPVVWTFLLLKLLPSSLLVGRPLRGTVLVVLLRTCGIMSSILTLRVSYTIAANTMIIALLF